MSTSSSEWPDNDTIKVIRKHLKNNLTPYDTIRRSYLLNQEDIEATANYINKGKYPSDYDLLVMLYNKIKDLESRLDK